MRLLVFRALWISLTIAVGQPAALAQSESTVYQVGLARRDITPKFPIRLNGFGFRRTESEGVTQQIWAKSMAIDDGSGDPTLLITVDILGIPEDIRAEIARRLEAKAGLKPDRLSITATHTHTAPMLRGANPTLFGVPIPKEHLEHIDRYTVAFLDHLESAGLEALQNRKPARLHWGIGRVGFAKNRRTGGGPVDHDLPLLVVRDLKGKIRALYVSYACHCVTLSDNKISGDWAGYAAQAMEDEVKDAVALISVGCGADANPRSGVTGDKAGIAAAQGKEIADEVKRMLAGFLAPVSGKIESKAKQIELPLADLPSRQEWEQRSQRKDAVGHHARMQLGKLDRKEVLPTKVDYQIQSWSFGDVFAMVFLPGEVVVDYSLRLKRELDGLRLWFNGYANQAPCYIPSERILKEGGYEGGDAMIYYDLPARFRTGMESLIISTVREQIAGRFSPAYNPDKTQNTRPLSPQQAVGAFRTKPNLKIDLVVAEPFVTDPVAIDFGPDGRLWVAEMIDYPAGKLGKFEPGGRIRVLEDSNGDGVFNKATVFLDNIPFPTGITVWRKGVLICAAPDIIYAEDSKRDCKADIVKKLYSGFATHNYHARVNSLEYGLDGWVHGSCGLFGGNIRSHILGKTIPLGDRDFRIKPDTGEIEPATGQTQQGRPRDDWGNWFGCDNTMLCRHYVLADHYLRRNPFVAPPDPAVYVPDFPNSNRLFPAKKDLQMFQLSGPAHNVTAACGLGVYRDDLLGPEFTGNTFTCEAVNLLVHRLSLSARGSTFSGRRAADETESEFLASVDNWCRPVQARTGPDGAFWVVDMYRFVIEHPRWIPPQDLAQLDVRAGQGLGRVFRVRPGDKQLRPWSRLDKLDAAGLVAALDSPNGWQRDMAGQMLFWNQDLAAVAPLKAMAKESARPLARLHALCVLDSFGKLTAEEVLAAVDDVHSGVRRHALRLSERFLDTHPELGTAIMKHLKDDDAQVRLQLAYTLGAWHNARSGNALAEMVPRQGQDPYLTAAVLSSLNGQNLASFSESVFARDQPPEHLMRPLLGTAAGMNDGRDLATILKQVTNHKKGTYAAWQLAAFSGVLESLESRGKSFSKLPKEVAGAVAEILSFARNSASDEKTPEAGRVAAVLLLGREPERHEGDLRILGDILQPQNSATLQNAALAALGRIADDGVPTLLVASWRAHTPAMKSQVLEILLSRESWQQRLLKAVENNEIPAAQVDVARRQRLLNQKNVSIRQLAEKLFAESSNRDRQKVVQAYSELGTLTGDRLRGKAVFAKTCAVCHQLEGVGHVVGPDLAAVANKTRMYLLTEILDPNRNVDTRYVEYQAALKNGRLVNGIMAGETATSILLRGQEGKEQNILRSDIDALSSSGKSLMPEGLEKELPKEAMADLLAYLSGTSNPPREFAGNKPVIITPIAGTLRLLATQCEIHGESIAFEPEFRNIGMWHGEKDHVVWRVRTDKSAKYDVYLDYACQNDSAGNYFAIDGMEPPLQGSVEGTGGWDKYRRQKIGTAALGAGNRSLVFRPAKPLVAWALIDLRGVYLVPEGGKLTLASDEPPTSEEPTALARQLLDDSIAPDRRQAIIIKHPENAAKLVKAMTQDMPADNPKEEYRRIPWIWRVAIAAGRRNNREEIRALLDVALPGKSDHLRDWQAVVVGGGIINGISQTGPWPAKRMKEIIGNDQGLAERLQHTLQLAVVMADNEKVTTGTRYDALRIIPLLGWKKAGPQLKRYLVKGTNEELQMGAISGAGDTDVPAVGPLLADGVEHFPDENRRIALSALLRTDERVRVLLDAISEGRIKTKSLTKVEIKLLWELKNEKLRTRALELLKSN